MTYRVKKLQGGSVPSALRTTFSSYEQARSEVRKYLRAKGLDTSSINAAGFRVTSV